MRCFRCASEIIALPEGDPRRVVPDGRFHYAPTYVVDVVGGGPAGGGPCRAAVLCWLCMNDEALPMGMWMSDEGWDVGAPAVTYAHLPPMDHDDDEDDRCWTPETYAAWAPKEGR